MRRSAYTVPALPGRITLRTLRAVCLLSALGMASGLCAQQSLPDFITSEPAPPPPSRAYLQAPPPNASGTHSPSGAIRISGGVMAGQLINRVDPVYPDTDAEGTVVLHAIIGPDGTVQQLSVIAGPPPLVRRSSRRRSPVDLQALPAQRRTESRRYDRHCEFQALISNLCLLHRHRDAAPGFRLHYLPIPHVQNAVGDHRRLGIMRNHQHRLAQLPA